MSANVVALLGVLVSAWVGYLAWKPNKANSDASIGEKYGDELEKNARLREKIVDLKEMVYKADDLDELKKEVQEYFEKN